MEHQKELQDYVDTLVTRSGSDIHLVAGTKPVFRENRELIPFIQKEVLSPDDTLAFLRLLTGTADGDPEVRVREEKHILFRFKSATATGEEVNFRVTAYLEKGRVAIAMRLIPKTARTMEELGLPPVLANIIKEPYGLFLMVGPAGNGKSTTLAAMINHCNDNLRRHILTIEDPIEFIFSNRKSMITQREIPEDAVTFRSALDSALRADADILMIGEMRETATMRTAMTAAEVGHLVLSTAHANSAASTVHRIIDSFPPEQQRQISNQLAGSLLGVCSIRLLPRVSGGLVPVCEVLLNNAAVANLIREGRVAGIETYIQTGREEGMLSLEHSLADLVKRNEITLETANLHASDERALMKYL